MITGDILIGAQRVPGRERSFRAINPATGETLEPAFAFAGPEEVRARLRSRLGGLPHLPRDRP